MQGFPNRFISCGFLSGKLKLNLHLLPHFLFLGSSQSIFLSLLHALAEVRLYYDGLLLGLNRELVNFLLEPGIGLCDGVVKELLYILGALDRLLDIIADLNDLVQRLGHPV